MKNIKKVIVPAIAAIALCISLIAGATYAWFTDTAKSNVNTIKSGKLDVALEMSVDGQNWESAEGKTLSFLKMKEDGTLAADENVLWEPGCTYKLPYLRVVNNGNLALKYKMILTGATGNTELLEVISFTAKVTKNGENAVTMTGAYGSVLMENTLVAPTTDNAAYDVIELSAHMSEEAGNEYQNLAIENIAITVYATQAPVEYDSNGNKYDEKVSALEDIKEGEVTLSEGVLVYNPGEYAVKASGANTVVNITDGIYDGGRGGDNICLVAINGATVNVYGGTFTVGGDANGLANSTVYAAGGNFNIYGGFFKSECTYQGKYYVLNKLNNSTSSITVYGGTFVNQNPADGDDSVVGDTFVAEGYTVVSKKVGNDTWYTVVAQPENKAALTNVFAMGGNIEVNNDIVYGEVEDTVADMVVISKPTTLKLYKKLISPDDMGNNGKNFCALVVDADTTINATEEGGIDTGKNGGYGINVRNGATLTINGGYYYGGGTTVQVQKGTLVINGGFFACEPYSDAKYGYKFLINCIDAAWKDGSAKIVITGGTFVNFDPMDSASENPRGNFLGEGYKTVKTEQANGDVWYTVVKK